MAKILSPLAIYIIIHLSLNLSFFNRNVLLVKFLILLKKHPFWNLEVCASTLFWTKYTKLSMIQKISSHMWEIKNQSYLLILLQMFGKLGMNQIPILVQYQKLHSGHWQLATLNGQSIMTLNVIKILTQLFCLWHPVPQSNLHVAMGFVSTLMKG